MVHDTPLFQDASTHQIWNSYSKNIGDMDRTLKRDRRTDSAITICLPKFLWGHKNDTDNVKTVYPPQTVSGE